MSNEKKFEGLADFEDKMLPPEENSQDYVADYTNEKFVSSLIKNDLNGFTPEELDEFNNQMNEDFKTVLDPEDRKKILIKKNAEEMKRILEDLPADIDD